MDRASVFHVRDTADSCTAKAILDPRIHAVAKIPT